VRRHLRRIVIGILAVIGALTVSGSLVTRGLRQFVKDGSASGVVFGPYDKPAAGARVFLDRGNGAVERYVVDSHGRFDLPLTRRERSRARWLICVPGGGAMVSQIHDPQTFQIGATEYSISDPAVPNHPYRAFGWLGPIPRECPPASDSVGWRTPATLGKKWYSVTTTEPSWK